MALLLGGLVVAASACFSDRVSAPDTDDVCTSGATTACVVEMRDNSYTPPTIRVTAGSTVTWRNRGASPHTTTGGSWDSGAVAPGESFAHAFPDAGTFAYECQFHPGMEGAVVVE